MSRGFSASYGGTGASDVITLAYRKLPTQLTISIWTYMLNIGGVAEGRMIEQNNGVIFYNYTAQTPRFRYPWSGSTATWTATSSQSWKEQGWKHLAVTYDASSDANDPIIYFEGTAIALTEDTAPSGTPGTSTNQWLLGNGVSAVATWQGYLAEMGMWTRVLSPAEILLLSKRRYAPSFIPTGLTLYHPLKTDISGKRPYELAVNTGSLWRPHPSIAYPQITSSRMANAPTVTGNPWYQYLQQAGD